MKRCVLILCTILSISTTTAYSQPHHHPYWHHYRHSGCASSYVYLVRSDYSENESNFKNCNAHYLLTKTTVNYYSNGSRRTYSYHTIFNTDGSIVIEDCTSVHHVHYNNQHFFLVRKNNSYKVITSTGQQLTTKNYKEMVELSPNRLLVLADRKYGIIDLYENTIIPLKYKSFNKISNDIYITKLNGYYGMINKDFSLIQANEYDKISPLYDTYLLKQNGKFGLADLQGNILLEPTNDKITKLGEYILVKKDKNFRIYERNGKAINNTEYSKIKLSRNTLIGKPRGEKGQRD